MSKQWKHDELLADLAGHLLGPDRMVWTDMQLGPSGSPRPDVYTLQKSYSKPTPTAYEIKVSRSDLRSDTTSGKWQSYLQYASSVTFAVPDSLCTVSDIPDGCGLIVRKAEVWRYARRPTIQRVTPPFDACMKLLIDGVNRTAKPFTPTPRRVAVWEENEAVRKKFGAAVDQCARDLVAAEARLADARSSANGEWDRMRRDVELVKKQLIATAERELAEWTGVKNEILQWLGLEGSHSTWSVQQRLREMRQMCDGDARVKRAEADLSRARHALQSALATITPKDATA